MSNAVLYDPLLVRYLARELDDRLGGRACAAAPRFAADGSVTLALDRGEALRIDLHPTRGWFRLLPAPASAEEPLDAICAGIEAPEDERWIRLELASSSRFRSGSRALIVELHANQWNALLVGEDGRIVSVMNARRSGARALLPGEGYAPPAARSRLSRSVGRDRAIEHWGAVAGAPAQERTGVLLANFAYTGTVNAAWILATGGEEFDAGAAFERWWWLCGMPEADAHLLEWRGRRLPYPVPLEGIAVRGAPNLLTAMAEVAGEGTGPATDPRLARGERLARQRRAAAERKLRRLREELHTAGEAAGIRALGDLLLANLHRVPRGGSSVSLEDWEGRPVEVELDPRLTPADNAARFYEQARRRERAAQRLPERISATEAELDRWASALEAIGEGALPAWLAATLESMDGQSTARARDPTATPREPFRRFRTSGGLEVRVGRGSRENDRLTFGESAPNDVWLHARSVPGSHVILRWADADAAPPARDLAEAAQLAAVFSRARTSGTVAVDWTRRKYVRKPRGAAPGLVIPQRVKTLFVEPDPAVVERLAAEPAD